MSEQKRVTIHLTRTPLGVGLKLTGTTREEFAALLNDFKTVVGPHQRRYDAELKCWIVSIEAYPALRSWASSIVRIYKGEARVEDGWSGVRTSDRTPPPHPSVEIECALRTLAVLPAMLDYPELLTVIAEHLRSVKCAAGDEAAEREVIEAYETLVPVLNRVAHLAVG